jgi:hypothetical protein
MKNRYTQLLLLLAFRHAAIVKRRSLVEQRSFQMSTGDHNFPSGACRNALMRPDRRSVFWEIQIVVSRHVHIEVGVLRSPGRIGVDLPFRGTTQIDRAQLWHIWIICLKKKR